MPPRKQNPASGGSRSRVMKLDVPGRKFDNGQFIVFTPEGKGTEGLVRHDLLTFERKGKSNLVKFVFGYEYDDLRRPPQGYRVYRQELGGCHFYDITPIEDLLLYTGPGLHDEGTYWTRRRLNALARSELRRIIRANPACPIDFGLGSEENELFWDYFCFIEDDDIADIAAAGFSAENMPSPELYRDPRLVVSDWRLWWRAPV